MFIDRERRVWVGPVPTSYERSARQFGFDGDFALLENDGPASHTDAAHERIQIALRDGQIVGSAIALILPGGVALLRSLAVCPEPGLELRAVLLKSLESTLSKENVKLLQWVTPVDGKYLSFLINDHDFFYATDLIFLASEINTTSNCCSIHPTARFQQVDSTASELHRVVQQTFDQTNDCIFLNGYLSADDLLENTIGRNEPVESCEHRWWLIFDNSSPVGCLLLREYGNSDQYELGYFGVVPTARGRRFGIEIVSYAQQRCNNYDRQRLTTIVDYSNFPARRVYEETGFQPYSQRKLYVKRIECD